MNPEKYFYNNNTFHLWQKSIIFSCFQNAFNYYSEVQDSTCGYANYVILQYHLSPLGGSGAYAIYIGKVTCEKKEEEEPCYELYAIWWRLFS